VYSSSGTSADEHQAILCFHCFELPALKPYQSLRTLRKTPTFPDDSSFPAITIIPSVPESQRCWRACVTLRLMMPVRSWVNASWLPLLATDSVSRPAQ